MTKRATAFQLTLPPKDGNVPSYKWLYDALRSEILEGRLRRGARLPATRDLAQQYGLARGTVVNAFELLKSEGYLQGTTGSGTFVSEVLPEDLLEVAKRRRAASAREPRIVRKLSAYGKRIEMFPGFAPGVRMAFRTNLPALDLFPVQTWTKLVSRRLRNASVELLRGCDAMGYRPLREAIAEYLNTSRGVKCVAEQVVIVSGVQEALDVTTRLLVDPGDRVCIEDPGYYGARIVFDAALAKISPLPVDDGGVQLLERSMRGARLVYVTPAHQAPLGVTMSLRRRLQLLEWARTANAMIFEDDYDSEYRYSGRPVPALQGLDTNGCVVYAGSFSKVLFPSLRLGYVVVPLDLAPRFEAVKSVTTRHSPLVDQAVVCDFIVEGYFGRHLRRMREVYAERQSVLLECARQRLGGLLELSDIEAGLQTIAWLCNGIDADAAAKSAAARDVAVTPLGTFYSTHSSPEGLQLGFAAADPREIRRGVRELAAALEALVSR